MDLTKRDMTLTYEGRSFAVRAYLDGSGPDGPAWHTIIIENRTPLRSELGVQPNVTACFAEAVRFVTTAVEAQAGASPVRA